MATRPEPGDRPQSHPPTHLARRPGRLVDSSTSCPGPRPAWLG
jgi:hypothetical protein